MRSKGRLPASHASSQQRRPMQKTFPRLACSIAHVVISAGNLLKPDSLAGFHFLLDGFKDNLIRQIV